MARRTERHSIPGPVGQLEAMIEFPDDEPSQLCLICHPHPLHRGSMHNKVVYRVGHGFRRAGAVVLRFNFRGVGASEGVYDHGIGEVEDARAALGFLRGQFPALPYSIAGFSFGSGVALRLACSLETDLPQRVVPVGIPVLRAKFDAVYDCPLPKFFIQSTRDEFGPVAETEAAVAKFSEPKTCLLYTSDAADE